MKYFTSLLLVVLVIASIASTAKAKKISRCNNNLGVGGGFRTGKITQACGEKLKFYCYNYGGNPYCETLDDDRIARMKECCKKSDKSIRTMEI